MLLLASASPARRRLLEQACIPHRVMVSGVDEDGIHADGPRELVQKLAQAKASAVRERLRAGGDDASVTAVLGCDSVLAFDGEVFGKPADAAGPSPVGNACAAAGGTAHRALPSRRSCCRA